MKQYTVYFSEPVCHKYIGDKFNKELKKWEYDVECEEWNDTFTFYSLKPAKDLIKVISTSTKVLASPKHGQMEIGRISVKSNLPAPIKPL